LEYPVGSRNDGAKPKLRRIATGGLEFEVFLLFQKVVTKGVKNTRMIALAIGSGLVWMESRRTTVMD
jgi:hypothetical protein